MILSFGLNSLRGETSWGQGTYEFSLKTKISQDISRFFRLLQVGNLKKSFHKVEKMLEFICDFINFLDPILKKWLAGHSASASVHSLVYEVYSLHPPYWDRNLDKIVFLQYFEFHKTISKRSDFDKKRNRLELFFQ